MQPETAWVLHVFSCKFFLADKQKIWTPEFPMYSRVRLVGMGSWIDSDILLTYSQLTRYWSHDIFFEQAGAEVGKAQQSFG